METTLPLPFHSQPSPLLKGLQIFTLVTRVISLCSVGLICKFFNLMESPLFHAKGGWKEMHAIAWASTVIFDNVEKIVDQIQRNGHLVKLSQVLEDMPQTEILLTAILQNLSPLVLDVVDIITMKPIHLVSFLLSYFLSLIINPPLLPNFFPFESFVSLQISILDDYKSQEEQWPCVQRESVGAAMELRSGTREIIREIERISCNPTLFVQEWREQPVLTRAKKIASIFIERILTIATFSRGNQTYNLRVRTFSVSERQHDTLAAFQLDLGLHQISSIGEEARRSGQRREKGCSRGAADFLGRLGVSRPRSEEYIRQEVARHEKRFQVWIDNRIKIGREID